MASPAHSLKSSESGNAVSTTGAQQLPLATQHEAPPADNPGWEWGERHQPAPVRMSTDKSSGSALAVLPSLEKPLNPPQVELGKLLFFDPRLSGDATISCATCHSPEHGWADGLALSRGYPGSRYFRNTPTVLNAALGRLPDV